jgi:general secretion pathway protein L
MITTSMKTRFKFTTPLLHTLTDFWSWWITELKGMLPKSVRTALLPGVERLYLQLNGTELITRRDTGESNHETGSYPLSASALRPEQEQELKELAERCREVVLCLPADKVLVKTLTLPLVAEENLREVLGFEMDRQTPFTADQVYYDHVLTSRNSKAGNLTLDLVVTPRRFLDEILSTLEAIGFHPHQATICIEAGGQAQPFNLLPAQARQAKLDTARYLNLALGTLALVLLVGTIALPIVNKLQVIRSLEARAELVTAKAEVTRRLREEVDQLGTDSLFLVEKKRATPLALEIINELTRILPDDTWIQRLDIKDQEVQIQGQSASAAALIPLIESSDQLRNPRFRSPVTRLPRTDNDRFHLSAEVATRNSNQGAK